MRFRPSAGAFFGIALFIVQTGPLSAVSVAADSAKYSFDTTALAAKPMEASGNIEFYPSLLLYNKSAPLYALKFGAEHPAYADQYNLKAESYLRYRRNPLLAFASGSLSGSYLRQPDSLYLDATLYEAYLKYSPVPAASILVGKRLFQWGKGYAYNPVSFAGRVKDLSNIDAALEGYWNLSFEYVKSFDSPLASIAFNAAVLPVYDRMNKGYLPDTSIAGLTQLYMLFFDTDIDFYLWVDDNDNSKVGLDFSRNVYQNWEVHGEWTFINKLTATVVSDDFTLVTRSRSTNNLVAGTRYLAPFNTTFILEYLHFGGGYAQKEMNAYWKAVDIASTASDPQKKQTVLRAAPNYTNAQFIATDYLFFKASHPDPFNFVYFTPAVYAVANLLDRSTMTGIEMSYNRSKHLLITSRLIAFVGDKNSEYGSRLARNRIELRAKWSF